MSSSQALLALDEVVMLLPAHQPRGARHRATCSSATSRSRTVHGTLPVSPTGVDALPVSNCWGTQKLGQIELFAPDATAILWPPECDVQAWHGIP